MAGAASNGRRLNSAMEDDYFPSFLTAAPSVPSSKSDKSKENSPLAMNRSDALNASSWSSKAKPRLTFAESLSMEKKDKTDALLEDSPFNFDAADGNYLDRMHVRRRKPHADEASGYEEDVPPPPTTSLLDPTSVLSSHLGGGDLADSTRQQPATTSRAPSATYFPSINGDEWGYDKQYWVTVYGFPASAKSYILHQFQTIGEVINFTAGAGNWLHIRYYTRLQAEKALTYDGKTLSGSIMIGVKKCYPSDLDGVREEPQSNIFVANTRQNPGSSDLEVDPTESDIMLPPRRRQDICSRVLNYLFKW
uniref:RRM Nup35-type domain-containing protein n=1 Tax=Globisporangium ultimum (strain ATCC 200006 / CBS 805.95 / DAOM BR144) TaxID=431595 RepID=K3XB43_GLOUD